MATEVEKSVDEVSADMKAQTRKLDGLNELELIGLPSSAQSYVATLSAAYERRDLLEQAFVAAGQALLADGYPGIPTIDMDGKAFSVLLDKVANINAVMPEFHTTVLTSLGSEVGAVFKK